LLKASSPARIINVSSSAEGLGKIDFSDLQAEKKYSGFPVYSSSKLANVMFTYELAKRLQGTGVTVNALHPGRVKTGFGDNSQTFLMRTLMAALKNLGALTPEQGADTVVYLATSPEVEGVTGKFFEKRKEKKTNPQSYDENANKRLWTESAKLVQLNV
jgi:retinol dehydrogenase 14